MDMTKKSNFTDNNQAILPANERGLVHSNDESTTVVKQNVSMAQVDLNECTQTQFGDRRVFRGLVEVNHILEIPANVQHLLPSTSVGFPIHREGLPSVQDNNTHQRIAPVSRQFSTSGESRGSNGDTAFRRSLSVNSRNIEQVSLIGNDKSGRIQFQVKYCILLFIVSSILATAIILTVIYGHVKESDNDLPVNFLHIYRERVQWEALPPKRPLPFFKYLPPKFVVVSHTASKPCTNPANCSIAIRNIQAGQMANAFDDIAYSFLVAGDGLIYEGRGWQKHSAVVQGMGCSSLAVAFVGNFSEVKPPQQQIDAFALLLDTSETVGKLEKNYKMFMHSDIKKTESPGQRLSEILRKWLHWRPFGPEDLLC